MRSRNSWFDRAVSVNALSRFWPVGVGYAVAMVFRLLQYIRADMWYYGARGTALLLRLALTHCTVLCAGGAVITAMLVYGWMFFPRHTAFMTALPVRREALFLSDMAAGFTLLTAGNVLSILLAALLGALSRAGAEGVFLWLAIMTLQTVLFFGFASFCATLTGSIVILPVVYTVLLYSSVALEASARLIVQYLVFGLTGQRRLFSVLSPVYYLPLTADRFILTEWVTDTYGAGTSVYAGFTGWPVLLSYAAAGILFALAALALQRRRVMERAGDVLAVRPLRGVFCWCSALAGAFTFGFIALRLIFAYTGYGSVGGTFPGAAVLLTIMLLGAFIGWFGARGLMRKSFRVFDGSWGGFTLFCAILAALVLGTEADLFGLERSIPAAEDVACVQIIDSYGSAPMTELYEPESIEAAIELHKSIVSHKAVYERSRSFGNYYGTLEISYYDASGSLLLARSYAAPESALAWTSAGNAFATDGRAWGGENPDLPALEELLNCREAVERRINTRSIPASAYTAGGGYAFIMDSPDSQSSIMLTGAEAWELYRDCILPDAKDSTLGQIRLRPASESEEKRPHVSVNVYFNQQWGDIMDYDSISLPVPEDAERTRAWLAAHGLPLPETEQADPPVTATYELPALEGLSALLEKVYLEYDPTAAGTVVSVRWTRSMLDWYADGQDAGSARAAAEVFARRYTVTESFLASLARLRAAGDQLVSGQLGLVRDYAPGTWTEETVNTLFDAILEGLETV